MTTKGAHDSDEVLHLIGQVTTLWSGVESLARAMLGRVLVAENMMGADAAFQEMVGFPLLSALQRACAYPHSRVALDVDEVEEWAKSASGKPLELRNKVTHGLWATAMATGGVSFFKRHQRKPFSLDDIELDGLSLARDAAAAIDVVVAAGQRILSGVA